MPRTTTPGFFCLLVVFRPVMFSLYLCVCGEYAPSFSVFRVLGISGFGDSFVGVEDSASENIQGIIFLGDSLMWNDANICGRIMELKIFVRDWSEMWKSLDIESYVMFLVPLMC